MDIIRDAHKNKNLHHAYLIEGPLAENFAALVEFLEEAGFSTRGNPDFWTGEFETMGIDEGRVLSDKELRRAIGGGWKVFVVRAEGITVEAQNSLLKVLEEPTEGTHFFFLMPSGERLLPTLRSRLEIVPARAEAAAEARKDAKKFLMMNQAERGEFLKPVVTEKDKSGALLFVSALEVEVRANLSLASARREDIFVLEEIEKGRQYLLDRSPSVKIILEHIAAIAP
ncbi:MAG TPA: hypothetical protein VHF05_00595 [Candidatus Paceibacterota bacterium]|nr:hypothetical protein [Candidatus Paceibacterota bacterium]